MKVRINLHRSFTHHLRVILHPCYLFWDSVYHIHIIILGIIVQQYPRNKDDWPIVLHILGQHWINPPKMSNRVAFLHGFKRCEYSHWRKMQNGSISFYLANNLWRHSVPFGSTRTHFDPYQSSRLTNKTNSLNGIFRRTHPFTHCLDGIRKDDVDLRIVCVTMMSDDEAGAAVGACTARKYTGSYISG